MSAQDLGTVHSFMASTTDGTFLLVKQNRNCDEHCYSSNSKTHLKNIDMALD